MKGLIGNVQKWWSGMSETDRKIRLWLGFLMLVSIVMQIGPRIMIRNGTPYLEYRLWEWYIEDAAISFAYARNLAAGDGLVSFIGGERVEGYSNPLWVLMQAGFYLIGVDGFWSSKLMAMVLGCFTTYFVWDLTKRAVPRANPYLHLIGPFFLVTNAQFAIWSASGLENSLFCFLLAGGLVALFKERDKGGFPFSALWFLGLAVTRPEAIMYGAWAGFLAMVYALRAGRGIGSTIVWLVSFFVPFIAYHVARYNYFAWPFPNTYYAKMETRNITAWNWNAGAWRYLRKYSLIPGLMPPDIDPKVYGTGRSALLWLPIAGLITLTTKWRRWLVAGLCIAVYVVLAVPGPESLVENGLWFDIDAPKWMLTTRMGFFYFLTVALLITPLGTKGGQIRLACWGMVLVTLFFTVRSGGDWMRGFRWFSFFAVPMSVILASGAIEVSEWLSERLGRAKDIPWTRAATVTVGVIMLLVWAGDIGHFAWFLGKRETSPFSVQKRAMYSQEIMDKLFVDGRVYNVDVDMGAHMYWSDHHMLDMAGLVDVPYGHHRANYQFVEQHIFDEHKPQFAHVHGPWANKSRIPRHDRWDEHYLLIAPYHTSRRSQHVGNHIRRDLVFNASWLGSEGRNVELADDVRITGWDMPSPEVGPAGTFYLEVGVQVPEEYDRNLRLIGYLVDAEGQLFTFDLPLVHDWLPTSRWRGDEVYNGKFGVTLHRRLKPGVYDLGFAMWDKDGVLPVEFVPEGAAKDDETFVQGAVRFPAALTIGEFGTSRTRADEDYDIGLDLAANLACDEAEEAWRLARRHVVLDTPWEEARSPRMHAALATCWADRAKSESDYEKAAWMLDKGRAWDSRVAALVAPSDLVSDHFYQIAQNYDREGKSEEAYRAYRLAVVAKPTNAWARRYAEEARERVLGTDPESVAKREAERAKRREEAAERRKKLEEEREERKKKAAEQRDREPPVKGGKKPPAEPDDAGAPKGKRPVDGALR